MRLRKIYADVRLELVFDPEVRAVDASIRPLGGIVRVSEGGVEHHFVAHPRKQVFMRGSLVARWRRWGEARYLPG